MLRAVSRNDAAEYKCVARNNIGVDESTAILYVRGMHIFSRSTAGGVGYRIIQKLIFR